MENEMILEKLLEMLEERRYKELKTELESLHPVDIAEMMEELDEKQILLIFRLLEKDEAAEVFTEMNSDLHENLLNALTDSEIAEFMEEMYLDDTVDIVEELPANVVKRLLQATDEETRAQINELLKYPEDSAGSIMNVEYIAFQKEMTVEDAILKIRQVGINRETIYTCYVTEQRRLIGVVSVKDLLTSGDNRLIEEIMETNIIYVNTHDDQEEAASLINKYGMIAIPVVDNDMRMVGIVTVDDAMEVIEEETTEDMSMMAGIVAPSEDSYFETSVWQHAKSRFPWLLILMLSATLSGLVLGYFEDAILTLPILNTFITMLTGTGGNCGSQSSTLIIRGLAVDEIEFKDIFKVLFKELRVALLVGAMLAIVNGIRIIIMYNDNPDAVMLAVVLGITMICTVLLSKILGCILPLLAKKCKLDPALMAAPLITTLVDAGTILIYFIIATRMLGL